jgi:hypothetical protein
MDGRPGAAVVDHAVELDQRFAPTLLRRFGALKVAGAGPIQELIPQTLPFIDADLAASAPDAHGAPAPSAVRGQVVSRVSCAGPYRRRARGSRCRRADQVGSGPLPRPRRRRTPDVLLEAGSIEPGDADGDREGGPA